MTLQESGEMYLEAIYVLSQTSNAVRGIDIANYLGYSKPSVSRAIGLLKDQGLVKKEPEGFYKLTEEGKNKAKHIYERHTVLTAMFISLGVDEQTASEDACRVEHYISDKTFDAIKAHMKEYSSSYSQK